jgi:hypothetical protein
MQTFLTVENNYTASAKTLDDKRLGKQRVEAYQILRTLLGKSEGWKNHPAVLMWAGYEECLFVYAAAVVQVWKNRGYKDTIQEKLHQLNLEYGFTDLLQKGSSMYPPWMNDKLVSSHRQVLLYKNPEHYKQFGWTEEPKYEYWWPTHHKGEW